MFEVARCMKKKGWWVEREILFYEPLLEKIKSKIVGPSTVDNKKYIRHPLCHSVGQGTRPGRFDGKREGRGYLFPLLLSAVVISFGG